MPKPARARLRRRGAPFRCFRRDDVCMPPTRLRRLAVLFRGSFRKVWVGAACHMSRNVVGDRGDQPTPATPVGLRARTRPGCGDRVSKLSRVPEPRLVDDPCRAHANHPLDRGRSCPHLDGCPRASAQPVSKVPNVRTVASRNRRCASRVESPIVVYEQPVTVSLPMLVHLGEGALSVGPRHPVCHGRLAVNRWLGASPGDRPCAQSLA